MKIPAVITTLHRGVFFGYIEEQDTDKKTIRAENVRMAIRWSPEVRGVVGLAANGPTASCRISPAAPVVTLMDVTAVMKCSKEATAAWEKAPWDA